MCANISRPIYYLNQQLIQVTGSGNCDQTPTKQVGGSRGRGGSVGSFVGRNIVLASIAGVIGGAGLSRNCPLIDGSVLLGGTGVSGGGR
ncbi:MAG: hypothetical protein LRY33_00850 [Parabacteroides chartae]|nr:hypothetical protein [Parabacteroides chartae]